MQRTPPKPPPLTFVCGGCGLALTVPIEHAGSSGPCPSCGAWLTSPQGHVVVIPRNPRQPAVVATGSRAVAATRKRRVGRIRADSGLDHAQIERRETAKSLVVIACFVLAACACIAVTWYLTDWLKR